MLVPIVAIPPSIEIGLAPYRDLFPRIETYQHIKEYCTGLVVLEKPSIRSVAMLVMHFGHRDPEMHSHDATSYYAAIRPASAASHPYAVRHSFHNDFTPGGVACFARTTPGYRGLLDLAFGSPCLVDCGSCEQPPSSVRPWSA